MVDKIIITLWGYTFYIIGSHISSDIYKYILYSRHGFIISIKPTEPIKCNIDELVINYSITKSLFAPRIK